MESIRRQVGCARWRLNCQAFLQLLPWTLFAAATLALAAVVAPKIWFLGVNDRLWLPSWAGGSLLIGLLAALAGTWFRRRNSLEAALEIDQRFGLKERVSSALALAPDERESSVGQALVADAECRLQTVEVREAFGLRWRWTAILPLPPIVVGALLAWALPNAVRKDAQAAIRDAELRQRIQRSARELGKKVAARAKLAGEAGLTDANSLLKEVRAGAEQLERRDDADHKQALVQLNELTRAVEKRRNELGGTTELQRQLERLKDLAGGPAEKLADALRRGDPEQALQELKRLTDALQSGALSPEERQQLARQLQDVRRRMQELADQHRQAKQELQRQIQQKLAEGDREAAGKLQRKLDELQSQEQGLDRLDQLAGRLQRASEALEQGDGQQATAELNEMARDLQEMQNELDQMEQLDELLDEINGAKSSLKCENCSGEGCAECQGGESQFSRQDGPGDGLNEGQGSGERPEAATKTGAYESRVRAKPKGGESIRSGDASGPNRAGLSQQQVQQEITGALRGDADPVSEQRLPRAQQDHVRQYFELRRKGDD